MTTTSTSWKLAVLVPLLLSVGAACGNGSGGTGAASSSSSTAATDVATGATVPPSTDPAAAKAAREAEVNANLTWNLDITKVVVASVQRRMADLPERLYNFGLRHNGAQVYETLLDGGLHNTPGNLAGLEKGVTKNIKVEVTGGEYYLRYVFFPDGSRHATTLRFDARRAAGPPNDRLSITLHDLDDATKTSFKASYFDGDTFVTQGSMGSSELNGITRTTAKAEQIEALLVKLDQYLAA